MEEKRGNDKSAPSWAAMFDLSRSGFVFWIWGEMIRCHDGPELCFLGAALTFLQADTCHVLYRVFKKYKWSRGLATALWIILTLLTWGVVYKNSGA
jgi:hypothetical protein